MPKLPKKSTMIDVVGRAMRYNDKLNEKGVIPDKTWLTIRKSLKQLIRFIKK